MHRQNVIDIDKISVHRGGKPILDGVCVQVRQGDFLTIVGPNGAGKTMLLRCLMGLEKPDQGHVRQKKGTVIGYVPQHFAHNFSLPLSVRRFLTLGYRDKYQRWGGKTARETEEKRCAMAVDETRIGHLLDRSIQDLSGGELQMVLLSRALIRDPDILVLDEPAQNLDVPGQLAFYRLLERLYTKRVLTIVMVSHDLHLVMACTRKVICLFHHICCSGPPRQVTKDPGFSAIFGKDMARMVAAYQHSHDHRHDLAKPQAHDHPHDLVKPQGGPGHRGGQHE